MERVQGKDRKLWIPDDYLDPRLPTSGTSVGDDRRMSLIRKWLSGVSFSCLGVQAQACMIDFCPTFFSSHWVNLWLHSLSHGSWCCGGEGGNSKSRGGCLRAPARGPGPLAPSLRAGHPMKGEYPLQNPPFDSHPLLALLDEALVPFYIARPLTLWRRGWDSNPRTVAGQRFSRPPDSATLAPLRISVSSVSSW